MLHRMALRVLPSLSLAVTENSVRKKKRIVMFVPGLVAFAVYRVAKLLLPLSEPIVLLAVSGLVSLVTAVLAYRVGRATAWRKILREEIMDAACRSAVCTQSDSAGCVRFAMMDVVRPRPRAECLVIE